MATPGSAEESLRLAEHYRGLTDDELLAIAHDKGDLTDDAQAALKMEIVSRKLTIPTPEPQLSLSRVLPDLGKDDSFSNYPKDTEKSGTTTNSDEEDPYAEDRRLEQVTVVWSERDARQLQQVLNDAGIPFVMGREEATRVDDVTSNFSLGVAVGVMKVGAPWAFEAMKNYFPKDEPPEAEDEKEDDLAIHCPKCHSEDVVFDELVSQSQNFDSSSEEKYRWTCGSCGYEWIDDGVETKD
jgi:DNA-directed RNA polymerase subunit M/transcription elongation factor TFIIS